MAIKGLNLAATRQFLSKFDDGDDPTVWEIGVLDSRTVGVIRDKALGIKVDQSNLDGNVETSIKQHEMNFNFVQFGVKGYSNLQDHSGTVLPYKTVKFQVGGGKAYKILDPEVLKVIPSAVIDELANEVLKDNEFTEVDEKN